MKAKGFTLLVEPPKIRKPPAPPSRPHASPKQYSRKAKHKKKCREEWAI